MSPGYLLCNVFGGSEMRRIPVVFPLFINMKNAIPSYIAFSEYSEVTLRTQVVVLQAHIIWIDAQIPVILRYALKNYTAKEDRKGEK